MQGMPQKEESSAVRPSTDRFFDTEHLKSDLKGLSVRGGAVTMAAQGAKFFLRMGSTPILARLLTPEDYGLIAMVAVVTNFVMMFKDMGLSMATVQRDEIDHDQISTLFWINVFVSLAIMLVMAALAPGVARFYGKPELTLVTLALAGTLIFGGLTIQHQALLRRQMHFGRLAVIEIAAAFSGVAAAVIAAWYGAGYWALVIMQLVMAVSMAIGVWVACDWRPGLPKRGAGVRSMLAFGGNLTGFRFVNYFARNVDKMLIGKVYGPVSLGLYSKAYQLLMLPLNQVRGPMSAVFIPALSRVQNDPERYRRVFLRLMRMLCLTMLAPLPVLIIGSDWIIDLMLGPQYEGAGGIFTCLAVVAIVQILLSCPSWLFITQGRGRDMLYSGIICSIISVISFIVGLPWGVFGVALAYSISALVLRAPVLLFWAGRKGPVGTVQIIHGISPFCVVVCFNCLILFAFRYYFEITSPVWGLTYVSVLNLCGTVLIGLMVPTMKSTFVELRSLFKQTLRA